MSTSPARPNASGSATPRRATASPGSRTRSAWPRSQTPCPFPEAAGRLGQVIDRWIYTAALCFGLDLAEQARSCFRYSYSVYQVEYSRNLLFRTGAAMDRVFNTVLDRTRSRLDMATLRTLFGSKY